MKYSVLQQIIICIYAETADKDLRFFLLAEIRLHGSSGFFWP